MTFIILTIVKKMRASSHESTHGLALFQLKSHKVQCILKMIFILIFRRLQT